MRICWFSLNFVFAFLRINLEQETGEIGVAELEVPLVVELEQGRTVRMVLFQVDIVNLRFVGRMPALFTDVHLWTSYKQKLIKKCDKLTNLKS